MDHLMRAQQNGKKSTISLLQGAQVEVSVDYQSREDQGLWGRSVLDWAVEDREDLTGYTLDHSSLKAQDDLGRSPLHLAVIFGSLRTVEQLLAAQSPTDLTGSLGQTPLHYAAEMSSLAILEAVILASAELHACDGWSRTPLHLAAEENRPVLVEALMKNGAELRCDCDKDTPLHVAIAAGYDTVARVMLETERCRTYLTQWNDNGHTALHIAAGLGRLTLLENLLDVIPNPSATIDYQDVHGRTALHIASMNGHFDVVLVLLGAEAIANRLDKASFMAAQYAAEAGHEEIVEALIDAIPNHVNYFVQKWEDALPNSPSEKDGLDEAFVTSLIKVGAFATDQSGNFARMTDKWAPNNREALIKGAMMGLKTYNSEPHSVPSTFLMRAVMGRHENMVKLILRKVPEMPLEAQSYSQLNALSLAASQGNTAIVAHLISCHADLNAITDMQETACMELRHTVMKR